MTDGPGKSIFGEEQKRWLFETLKASDATFKVIINANPILGPDRRSKNDNYANSNFSYELDTEVVSFSILVRIHLSTSSSSPLYS